MAVDLTSRATAVRLVCALAALSVVTFATPLDAQTTPTQKPCTKPCPAPETVKPSTAEQFPFPGEASKSSEAGRPADTTPPDAPAPASQPVPAAPAPDSGGLFPFPGETPAAAGSSSSSSSSDADPAPDADKPPASDNAEKSPRRRLPKVKKLQSDEDRESEDITVARFYRDRGSWNAAYQRSKDAVKHQPDDPEAHLLLAETAQKLDKRDEAIAEYSALLKLDASEDEVKTARKALARLNASNK